MEREKIMNTIVKNLKLNVDGLEDVEIDPSKSIIEYGASSLDNLEIVSATMRELQIQVPRTAISNVKNINELVDWFAKTKS